MRERVQYREVGRQEFEQGFGRWVRRWHGRRPAPGPRPVRPVGAAAAVRPFEPPRPVRDTAAEPAVVRPAMLPGARPGVGGAGARGTGPRVLVRGGAGAARGRAGVAGRVRRVAAGIVLAAATAAVVVALGLLAGMAEPGPSPVRAPDPVVTAPAVAAPVVVTAEPGETVWDVAGRVAPGRPGAEVAAVAERIVADNALRSVRLEPGQVLRVAGD